MDEDTANIIKDIREELAAIHATQLESQAEMQKFMKDVIQQIGDFSFDLQGLIAGASNRVVDALDQLAEK